MDGKKDEVREQGSDGQDTSRLGQQEQDNDAHKHLHGILDSTSASQRKVPGQAFSTLILNWA
jgi:hypothetical protein